MWVEITRTGKGVNKESLTDTLRATSEFVEYLESLRRFVMNLQMSIQFLDTDEIHQTGSENLPFLPSAVVRAFEEFLLSHVALAHRLSRQGLSGHLNPTTLRRVNLDFPDYGRFSNPEANSSARAGTQDSQSYANTYGKLDPFFCTVQDALDVQTQSMEAAVTQLKQAERDLVLLSTTTSQTGSVNLTAIGPEFLMAVIFANLNTHIDGNKVDLAQKYNQNMIRIMNQASRNPQRRLFLDLCGLEDDMTAIKSVLVQRHNTMSNFDRLLDPKSYRVKAEARRMLYEVEHAFIKKELIRLDIRLWRAQSFLWGVNYYRGRIKQQIEVLEEGHGKAIRVFTFITAFFLPL